MELKQVVVNNSGMSQDLSISKQDNKFAFENRNIRVQSTDDGTLLSITNLKDPLLKNTTISCMKVLGTCITPNYLVIFCKANIRDSHGSVSPKDVIYRIDLEDLEDIDNNACKVLYSGNLNFNSNSYFDTLYYEEGEYVKKVYWTDGINSPRVINIITPGERVSTGKTFTSYTENVFEFYPEIKIFPTINVTKNRNVQSELPAGVIQYFVSYYNINGTETLIAGSSDLYTIDFSNRGAKADETGACAFDITIPYDSINTEFDYIRVYSARRTSYDGQLSVFIVGNIKINKNQTSQKDYHILDNGIGQEQLQDGYIYFVGGTPFIAKTLAEKDGTVFFGNIKTEEVYVPDTLKNKIKASCFRNIRFSNCIEFELSKSIPNDQAFSFKYPYRLQLDKGSSDYRTFKSGETYRFGIQFQTLRGQWTDVVWVGDVECVKKPSYNAEEKCFKVNDATFVLPTVVKESALENGYVNYRILYADPERSNGRKIKAQGILCPTMFTPGQRALNAPYALPSWVMRPKNSNIAYHHFEPIFSSEVEGGEIASFTPKTSMGISEYPKPYVTEYYEENNDTKKSCYLVTYLAVSTGNKIIVRSVKVWATPEEVENNFYDSEGNELEDYEVLCDYLVPYGGIYNEFGNALSAVPKKGSKENPYGFKGVDDNKYVYTQVTYSGSDSPTTDGVRGWIPTWSAMNLDVELIPSPKTLGNIAFGLSASGYLEVARFMRDIIGDGDNYYGNNGTSALSPYYIGKHIREVYTCDDEDLGEMLDKKFFPLHGRNISQTANPDKVENERYEHSGAKYNEEDGLKDAEDSLFSKVKSVYKITTRLGYSTDTIYFTSFFCTLPEIFRPRCIVDGTNNHGGDWGYDAPKYKHEYKPGVTSYDGIEGYWYPNREAFIQVIPLVESERLSKIKTSRNDYYVDESILTLNSPDIDLVGNKGTIKLNIVGAAPIINNQSALDADTKFVSINGIVNDEAVITNNAGNNPFYSEYIYYDFGWTNKTVEDVTKTVLDPTLPSTYRTYLFEANNFLGITSEDALSNIVGASMEYKYGEVSKQQILNQHFSDATIYFDDSCDYGEVYCTKINEDDDSKLIQTDVGNKIYTAKHDNLIVSNDTSHVFRTYENKIFNNLSYGSTRIKFSTTPHIVINLQDMVNLGKKYILPHFKEDEDYYVNLNDGKDKVFEGDYILEIENLYELTDRNRNLWKREGINTQSYKSVTSIWDAYNTTYNLSSLVSDDIFIPMVLYNKDEPIGNKINGALKEVIVGSSGRATPDKIAIFLRDNNIQWTRILNTFTIEDTGRQIIFGVFDVEDVHPISNSSETKRIITTHKYRITSIGIGETGLYSVPDEYTNQTSDPNKIVIDSVVYNRDGNPLKLRWYYMHEIPLNSEYPTLSDYTEYVEKVYAIDFPIRYESKELNTTIPFNNQYLFIGEVYEDINDEDLYGGTDATSLRLLTWIPASKSTSLDEDVTTMAGDTYYQRWDCLKTYPTTEEDTNQIVDITSFMVETHKNLDNRTDINRASYNLMSRPSNFNLYNEVYNQKNDIFTYTTNWNELGTKNVPNQIVWSMSKNYLGDVDVWTNVNVSSATNVKYPVTKLVTYNNNLLAITEHSLEIVNFNAKQLVQTEDHSFIELQNSAKVDGTTKLQYPYGSHNMSTLITEQGLYFIEDNEKSLIRLGGSDGITKIGITEFGDWFKNTIVQGVYTSDTKEPFRLEYDIVHKDIYIINNTYQLVYNESLKAFTSFLDYTGEYWLFNYGGKLYSLRMDPSITIGFNKVANIYEMYAGNGYNKDFGISAEDGTYIYGSPLTYSIWYRIVPDEYGDKVFTNGTLMADCTQNSALTNQQPFTTLKVWNEYQDTTETPLNRILDRPSNLKQRFRYWRFNIPRDSNSKFKRDRIRNPWINLQLKGDSVDKMEFHNLTVQYME